MQISHIQILLSRLEPESQPHAAFLQHLHRAHPQTFLLGAGEGPLARLPLFQWPPFSPGLARVPPHPFLDLPKSWDKVDCQNKLGRFISLWSTVP